MSNFSRGFIHDKTPLAEQKAFDSFVNFRTFIPSRNEHKCYMKISCKLHRCLSNPRHFRCNAYIRMKARAALPRDSRKNRRGKRLVTFPNLRFWRYDEPTNSPPFSAFVSQGKGRNKGEGGRESLTVIPIEDWLHSGDAARYTSSSCCR